LRLSREAVHLRFHRVAIRVSDGNLVTAQWRGSPKFSVGVLSAIDDEQAFELAAVSMSLAVKPGFKEAEMKACAKEIRTRAEAKRAAGLPPVMS